MKKYYPHIMIILYTISIFIVGMVVQIELSKNRFHKISTHCEWGDSDYESIWFIITGHEVDAYGN